MFMATWFSLQDTWLLQKIKPLCCMTSFEIPFTVLNSKHLVLYTLVSASCLSAMAAASPEMEQEVKKLLSPSCPLGINIRLQNVLAILEEKGLVYTTVLCPSSLVCHPQNRGEAWSTLSTAIAKAKTSLLVVSSLNFWHQTHWQWRWPWTL